MNILIYMPNVNRKDGGIFQYSETLLKNLGEVSQNEFTFWVLNISEYEYFKRITNQFPSITMVPLPQAREPFHYKVKRFIVNKILTSKVGLSKLQHVSDIDYLIKKFEVKAVHCPYQDLPAFLKVPGVSTMHDVQELYFPLYFSAAVRARRAVRNARIAHQADAVVVSYEHVKQDIVRFFERKEEHVHVCLLKMKDLWFKRYEQSDVLPLEDLNLPDKFLLYPAATWPHKNHIQLLRAMKLLQEEHNIFCHFVFTGHQNEHFQSICEEVKELALESYVHFKGVVNEQTLYSLYKKTLGVVVPTKYEAGSFPLMESMSLQVPVICSKVTSLPETIGNEAYCFDPDNAAEMAEKIKRLLTDADFVKMNVENSKKHALQFLQSDVFEKFAEIYRQFN